MAKSTIDVEQLVKHIVKISESESIFLTPSPQQELNSYELLDYISETSGISKEQIGIWCQKEQE